MDKYHNRGFLARLGLVVAALTLSLLLVACSTTPTATPASSSTNTTAASIANNASTTSAAGSAATNTPGTTTSAATTTQPATTAASTTVAATTAAANSNTGLSADQVESNSVVGVVNRISPAVVTVYNQTASSNASRTLPGTTPRGGNNTAPDQPNNSFRTQGIGSGIVISDQGYIITNAHVVEGQQNVTVAFNNGKKAVTAKVVGADTVGDIAVLKIDEAVPAVAKFGDSSKLQIGETVVAIGAALGDFRNSVTKGVVSGLNRTIDSSPSVYVQTDAPINHGNSGGPLLNLKGEIIGINTAVLRNTPSAVGTTGDVAEGLGFAIPSNIAKNLSDQLISKGAVVRPYFGITYQMITPAIAGTTLRGGANVPAVEGAWIYSSARNGSGVVSGSPADKAGLKDNDVITAINDMPLNDNNPLVSATMNYKPGDTVKLTVQRGSQSLTLNLILGERPKDLN